MNWVRLIGDVKGEPNVSLEENGNTVEFNLTGSDMLEVWEYPIKLEGEQAWEIMKLVQPGVGQRLLVMGRLKTDGVEPTRICPLDPYVQRCVNQVILVGKVLEHHPGKYKTSPAQIKLEVEQKTRLTINVVASRNNQQRMETLIPGERVFIEGQTMSSASDNRGIIVSALRLDAIVSGFREEA